MISTEMVLKTLVYSTFHLLTWQLAKEHFIESVPSITTEKREAASPSLTLVTI
jgi:hypothetical protein